MSEKSSAGGSTVL